VHDRRQVFKDDVIVKMLKETIYRDVYHNNRETELSKDQDIENLDYTLRYLESEEDVRIRNVTERSVILSPFNTLEEKSSKVSIISSFFNRSLSSRFIEKKISYFLNREFVKLI
jgi:hypothetical protein